MVRQGMAAILLAGLFWVISGLTSPAFALTPFDVKDISYQPCPAEMGEGMVTPGSIQEANCFLISGTAVNSTGKPIINGDIFGRIYDANDNPVMQNRTRLGGVEFVPPGESAFEIRVSVAANQPEPLKLKQFKGSGFTGKVRR